MSAISGTSNKLEANIQELQLELDSIKQLNSCLREYLTTLRTYKHNLTDMQTNCEHLCNVNQQFISNARR